MTPIKVNRKYTVSREDTPKDLGFAMVVQKIEGNKVHCILSGSKSPFTFYFDADGYHDAENVRLKVTPGRRPQQ